MNYFLKLGGRAIRSTSLIALISTGIRIGGGLLTLPIALRTIPQAELGLYYTFLGIAGIVSLFDFGFAPTVSRNAAYAMAGATSFTARGVPKLSALPEPNTELLSALLSAVKKWYSWIGFIALFLLLGFGTWFINNRIEAESLPSGLLGAWVLFAVAQVYSFSSGFWSNLLAGSGGVRDASKLGLVSQSIALVALVSTLLGGLTLWSYGISTLVGAIINRVLAKRAFFRFTGVETSAGSTLSVASVLTDLWPMAWRQGAVMLGAFLIQRGNTLICSTKLGLDETARYGLSLNLMSIIFQVSAIPLTIALPAIARLRVTGDHAMIWKIFRMRVYLGLTFASAAIVGLSLFAPILLDILQSQTPLLSTPIMLLLGVILLLEYHHSYYGHLVLSENQNPFIIPALVSGTFVFIASWYAAGEWGVLGLIAAQGAVQLAWNNWWTVLRGISSLRKSV